MQFIFSVPLFILVFSSSVFAQDIKLTPDLYEFSRNSITGVYLCTPKHVESGDCSDVDDEYYENLALISLGSYEIGLLKVNGIETIAFKGPMSPGAGENLIRTLERFKGRVDTLTLSSQGGSTDEAYKIAAYVKENKLKTWVPVRRMCLSACSFVFLNGEEMVLDGLLGLHSGSYHLQDPYQIRDVDAANETIKKALYENDTYLLKQVRLFLELGIDLDVIDDSTDAKGEFLIFDDLERLLNYDSSIDYVRSSEEMVRMSKAQSVRNFNFESYDQLF